MSSSAPQNEPHSRFSPLEWFFVWLAGAGHQTLSQCPDWERRKHASFGATVLIPTAFGFVASAYAASTLTQVPAFIVGIALLWALIILTIDRAFLAAYRPTLPRAQKITQFLLRFSIALLMGLTVAHPLVLLLFKDAVTLEIQERQSLALKERRAELAEETAIISTEIGSLRSTLERLRTQHRDTFTPPTLPSPSSGAGLEDSFAAQIALLDTQIQAQTQLADQLRGEIAVLETKLELELAGKGPSGISGPGPASQRVIDDIEQKTPSLATITEALTDLSREKSRMLRASTDQALDPETAKLQQDQAKAQQEQLARMLQAQNGLRASLQSEIDSTTQRITDLQAQKTQLMQQANPDPNVPSPNDLITRTFALHSLFHQQGGAFALSAYIVLSLVFMILDTIPLVAKFTAKKGPYDLLIEHQERTFDPGGSAAQTAPSEGAQGGATIPPFQADPEVSRLIKEGKPKSSPKDGYASNRAIQRTLTLATLRAARNGDTKPRTPPVPVASMIDLSQGHPLHHARALAKIREYFPSNTALATEIGITAATLSKYLKLLKMPQAFQDRLETITDLTSIEMAYRIASVPDPDARGRLLDLLASGSSQKEIRQEIDNLRTTA